MDIPYEDASMLEATVRRVFNCGRGGMGRFIDVSNFQSHPFDAALISLASLWQIGDSNQIEHFLSHWDKEIRNGNNGTFDVAQYIFELNGLVDSIMQTKEEE